MFGLNGDRGTSNVGFRYVLGYFGQAAPRLTAAFGFDPPEGLGTRKNRFSAAAIGWSRRDC
jgi:hypothetical protein